MSRREYRRKPHRAPAPAALRLVLECSPDGTTWSELPPHGTRPRVRLSLRGGRR